MAVSMEELREMADRLPRTIRECRDRYYTVAHLPEITPTSYRDRNIVSAWHMQVDKITFHHREVLVDGVRCLAWYYHDVLVRVCV
ncbi:hypothetical protein IB265_34710 [Ensifer sp. ENS10]|uniref:hypothetical protein n=1 Tax=Ensifer sp. ENS10 TaxID=2769286 RepID=UPI001781D52E|nr:hypothetical protein [Ensifer sp. ENS10]MBD9511903.1 hypothetical protein [Ensifer sp. ENS10]